MDISIYDKASGRIVALRSVQGTAAGRAVLRDLPEGQAYVRGHHDPRECRVDTRTGKLRECGPDMATLRSEARRRVARARRRAEANGIATRHGTVQSDADSLARIYLAALVAASDPAFRREWTLQDNRSVDLDAVEMAELAADVSAHLDACHRRARELKQAIHANTKAGLAALDIETGWPG